MTDSARRREAVRAIVAKVRTDAIALRDSIKDARTKTLLTPVLNTLNDMDSVFLSGNEDHAPWWFDVAERYTQAATAELQAISDVIQKYGGPENVRTIG